MAAVQRAVEVSAKELSRGGYRNKLYLIFGPHSISQLHPSSLLK